MRVIVNKQKQKYHYSPLRYPGGKTGMFHFFDRVMKNNNLEKITYIEPFAGGAGAAITLLLLEKVEKIIINDLDKAIYSFWKSSIFDTENFIDKVLTTPVSIKEWKVQKRIYESKVSNELKLGFATFYLNRTNISGILEGGPIGGIEQKGKYKIDARFNKTNLIHKLEQISMYKDRIKVFNIDGIELIKEYLNKDNTFVYLDPPYYEKGSALYLNHYLRKDHEKLAKCLNNNKNAFWILTYDKTEEIRMLYKNRDIINFSLKYNAYESRDGKEMLILSDAVKND